jgi:hypothetical protein
VENRPPAGALRGCRASNSHHKRIAARRERQLAAATPPAAAASGAALPFVCRRWRRVYNTSQLIHGTFNLNLQQIEAQLGGRPGDLAALLRLLGQRGQAGRRLWLQNEGNILSMEAVLNLVSPRLQAVSEHVCKL